MTFTAAYQDVLARSLRLLRSWGANLLDEKCGNEGNALAFSIRHGRRDAVSCFLSWNGPQDSVIYANLWTRSSEYRFPHLLQKDNGIRYAGQMWLSATERENIHNYGGFNYRDFLPTGEASIYKYKGRIWPLVEMVDLAIFRGHREILHDLLFVHRGLALNDREHRPPTEIRNERHVDYTDVVSAGTGQSGTHQNHADTQDSRPYRSKSRLKFMRLYMTSVASSKRRDIALA